MKRSLFTLMIVLTLIFGSTMLAKDYKEAVPIINQMQLAIEKFIGGLEKADTAPEIAAVITEYIKDVKVFAPLFRVILDKYPELEDEKTHPEALKPQLDKIKETTKKLMRLYGKVGKYMGEPEVKKAIEELKEASAALDPQKGEKEEEK